MKLRATFLFLALGGGARLADELDDRIRAFEEANRANRESRLRALEELGTPAALRALASFAEGDVAQRRARAEILAAIAPAEAIDGVLEIQGDPDEDVRRSIARFLGSPALGPERAADRLTALEGLASGDPSSLVRSEAITWIGRAALPGSAEALERLLEGSLSGEAEAAARALAELPAARGRLVALVREAFEGESASRLEGALLAELVQGYGRALADLAGGGREPPERVPFVRGRQHAAPSVALAARSALASFVARLCELGEFERAERALQALAGEGLSSCETLDQRIRVAFQQGDAARAAQLARELQRAAGLVATDEVRGWRFLGFHFEGAALFALGDPSAARERFERSRELVLGWLAERPDRLEQRSLRGSETGERWRAGGALLAERMELLALEELWIALALLAGGAEPSRPEVLELLRSAHEDTIRARIAALSSDVTSDFPLDDLLRRDLSPTFLVLLNRRLAGRDEEASYRWLEALGRALATIAPWEMPGFERFSVADERLADPLGDPARLAALARLREELLEYFGRQILRNQREAGLNLDVSLPVNQGLKVQQQAIEARIQEESARLFQLGSPDHLGAAERREIFHDLANYLTPSTRFALDLVENRMNDGRLESAEALARRMLADLGTRLPGVSDVESEHFLAGVERELGSVLSQANRPEEAEQSYSSAVRRLEALENSFEGSGDALGFLRRERAEVLVSLAVNSNVRMGDPARALEFFERAYALDQRDFMQVLLACYRARSGRAAEARSALRRVSIAPQLYYNLACTYALLGEKELALDFLARDLAENQVSAGALEARLKWARGDPVLAALRDDARFQRMMAEGR